MRHSMTEKDITTVIARHLMATLEPPPDAPVTGDTRLVDDLALDSLQSFEMVATLEDHYRVTLSIELLQDVRTVGDVARAVAGAVARQNVA
jgi:acyl carrier protein